MKPGLVMAGVAIAVAVTLVVTSIVVLFAGPPRVTNLPSHVPISIVGNGGFTAANGVRHGTGTPTDPFVIEGWEIASSTGTRILVRNADAAFIIRNVHLRNLQPPHGFGLTENIYLINVSNVRVEHVVSLTSLAGVAIQDSTNVTIRDSDFSDSFIGVGVYYSTAVLVSGNEFTRNDMGVWTNSSTRLTVSSNRFSSHTLGAMFIDRSQDFSITRNRIETSSHGIHVLAATNGSVSRNSFAGNVFATKLQSLSNVRVEANLVSNGGSVATWSSRDVVISQNHILGRPGVEASASSNVTISENTITLVDGFGLLSQGADQVRFFHNNVDATAGAQPGYDNRGPENLWDDGYPSGGNYWSTYGGVDICGGPSQTVCPGADGIGDTRFLIDSDSWDSYPLIAPITVPNRAPVAFFDTSPSRGAPMSVFTLNASSSWDLEDPIGALEARWDWEDDGVWDTSWWGNLSQRHQFVAEGLFTIRVQVRDSAGQTDEEIRGILVEQEAAPLEAGMVVLLVAIPATGASVVLYLLAKRQRRTKPREPPGSC